MRQDIKRIVALAVAMAVCVGIANAQEYLSPVALAIRPDGDIVYVAESGARKLAMVDIAARSVKKEIPLSVAPSGLAVAPDGRVFVTGGEGPGKIVIVSPQANEETDSWPAGHTPMAPQLAPDGRTLYVCNRFNNDVSVIDVASKTETARIPVVREPVASALTPDGKTLIVANHLPEGSSSGDYAAASISIVDTELKQVVKNIVLPNGSSSVRGVCLSPDGKFAYATHILARYQMPTTQLERGWMNTNALSILNVPEKKWANTVLLDDVDLGAANPWGVACSADGRLICVAHAGTHEISLIDAAKLHERLDKVAGGEPVTEVSQKPEDVPNDLSFLVGMRQRVKLTGNGPRGIAAAGNFVFSAQYFTDDLGVVDISPSARPKAQAIALGAAKEMSAVRKGEMYFNDAALCFQHWQSCASCHPDGRSDALNWDLLNDGMGNPKNTKSMLLSHRTPPAMSLGARDTAETAVRSGIKHIQFAVRPEQDAAAIDEYLKSLAPVPSPHAGEAAQRGKAVFEQAGCAQCHPGPLGTDLQSYDVGTATDVDKKPFDTPTLAEVWRTAPYLHDGRAATMMEVLTVFNKEDKHGKTSHLSQDQLNDLAAFVLSY